ncbi:hypothetical protein [Christiangramia echinicola]|uniref:hypothetical protein n=1 Tax=Christiangramia echinicola TaxID=279359 RepID=UPI000411AB33|nr:hypothetical protein [Christiangramia echinicola]
MNRFHRILKNYIIENSRNCFSNSGNGMARVLVKGIPFTIAEDFVQNIVELGGLVIQDRKIPIFLCDDKIDNWVEPKDENGGVCGKDYVLNLRNSRSFKNIIVLIGQGSSLDKSNTTSFIPIGINDEVQDEIWTKQNMVQYIVEHALNDGSFPFYNDKNKRDEVYTILENFKPGDSHQGEHESQWEFLQQISERGKEGSLSELKALMGFISTDKPENFNLSKCELIFSKIADSFESGIRKTIDEWLEKNIDEHTQEALKEFGNHFSMVNDSISSFRNSPFYYYSSISWNTHYDWWETLNEEKWQEILDETVDTENACKVEVTNALFRNLKPCPIVLDEANFKITHRRNLDINKDLEIFKKKRGYEKIDQISIDNPSKVEYEGKPSIHKTPIFYQFRIEGYNNSTQKIISLKNYEPGFVFDIAQIEKVSSLKNADRRGSKNKIWKSNLVLSNSGSHELNFYWDEKRFEFKEGVYKETSTQDSKKIVLKPLLQEAKGSAVFSLENEINITITLVDKEDGSLNKILITALTNDKEPVGVFNIYDQLIIKNKSNKGINEKVSLNPSWNNLHQIQDWIINSPNQSYFPILLGTDFRQNFEKPDWNNKALISAFDLNIDCRPNLKNYTPPSNLVEIRRQIIDLIINEEQSQESLQPLIEYRPLHNGIIKEKLLGLTLDYLKQYQDWFESDPEIASWFDIIAINKVQDDVLENDPFAILLNPFHPIRIAWQLQAQNILNDALGEIPCPAAGIFESSQFPDSFALPCHRSQSQFDYKTFLSIDSDSTYWSLLWNSEKLNEIKNIKTTSIFDKTFGLQIQGLDDGLSSTQIEHTLSDIFQIKSGQNSINAQVFSESSETNLFNEGVANWVSNNLGDHKFINNRKEVRDIWHSSGSKKLNIFDTRELRFQPSAEELVDITSDSGYNLKWYNIDRQKSRGNLDLTIISHLSNQSPALIQSTTSSIIFNGGVSRERIRYSTENDSGKISFTESRLYTEQNLEELQDDLSKALSNLIYIIEGKVNLTSFGHLNTTPQLSFVKSKLLNSDYCAISSSAVDPSAFFDSNGNNLLWDYELPSYSKKQSSKSGFYLLAKKSETIVAAVNRSVRNIQGMGNVSNKVIDDLLGEISGRGIPTLKTLASGGASANGEIGMLTAMQLLQNFDIDDESFEFFPFKDGNKFNLLVPVDPFSSQLNALYDRLQIEKLRPDLLAISICLNGEDIKGIKITPIEIKYRNSKMNFRELKSALEQCHNFTNFYNILLEKSLKSTMWDIARCRLLSDMLSFSFATYGRRLSNQTDKIKWAEIQTKVINSINNHSKITLNDEGRLLVVSNWNITEFDQVSSRKFKDVLKISFEDAKDLLLKQNQDKFSNLGTIVGGWNLMCAGCSNDGKEQFNNDSLETTEIKDEIKDEKENYQNALDKGVKEGKESAGEEIENTLSGQKEELKEKKVREEFYFNDGIKFSVGKQEGALKEIDHIFHPSNTKLNQLNVGIVGDLGTGKTQLIKALVYNITKYPDQNRGTTPKFLIMDTKRDYDGSGDKESDRNFVKSINAKIVKPHNLPINLFNIRNNKGGHPALAKAEFFIDILSKIFGGIGPTQEHNILSAVIECFEENGYQPYQDDYSNFISPTLKDIFIKYEDKIGNKKDVPFSIMYKLVLGRYFEPDANETIDFKDFFNQSVVLSLGGIAGNDKNLKMVMIFFLNMYREYMLGVKKLEFINSNGYQLRSIDSYLLIDEANLIMEYELPVLQDILLKGREFGIGIILSSQYLSHFKKSGTNYIEPLLTWFVHKVPNVSIRELEALGLTNVDDGMINKVKNLECHYCLYKGLGSPGEFIRGIPHYILDKENRK